MLTFNHQNHEIQSLFTFMHIDYFLILTMDVFPLHLTIIIHYYNICELTAWTDPQFHQLLWSKTFYWTKGVTWPSTLFSQLLQKTQLHKFRISDTDACFSVLDFNPELMSQFQHQNIQQFPYFEGLIVSLIGQGKWNPVVLRAFLVSSLCSLHVWSTQHRNMRLQVDLRHEFTPRPD